MGREKGNEGGSDTMSAVLERDAPLDRKLRVNELSWEVGVKSSIAS